MDKDLSGRVQSVDRAMTLLEVLGRDTRGQRLTELSRKSGLSLTTVHRLLTTLEQRHFVQFSPADNLWHIGIGAFSVGAAFSRDRNFVAAALPFLRRLRDQTKETANIGIVDDGEILLVDQIQSREINRSIAPVGGRTPMTASGMGKAILSCYSPDQVKSLVQQRGMKRATAQTITSFPMLDEHLKRCKVDGYSVDDQEYRPGLRCIAAPVFDSRDEVLCAISVSGTPDRIPSDRINRIGTLVAAAAADLSFRMTGRAPVVS